MAPEVLREERQGGPASDVYSFGILLYEIIVGRRAFEPSRPYELARKVVEGYRPGISLLL